MSSQVRRASRLLFRSGVTPQIEPEEYDQHEAQLEYPALLSTFGRVESGSPDKPGTHQQTVSTVSQTPQARCGAFYFTCGSSERVHERRCAACLHRRQSTRSMNVLWCLSIGSRFVSLGAESFCCVQLRFARIRNRRRGRWRGVVEVSIGTHQDHYDLHATVVL